MEYKKMAWNPPNIKSKNINNNLNIAVKFIIEETEKEKMQRRLMLGQNIDKIIDWEINSLKNDLKLSKNRSELCWKGK